MQHILKPYNSKAILSNIELVLKTGDSSKLNNPTYTFINLMSGFIAHYDLYGFQANYSDVSELSSELLDSINAYTPDYNYEVEQYGNAYADSKKAIYQALPTIIKKYQVILTNSFENKAKEALQNTYDLIGEVLKRNDSELILATIKKLELAY